MMQIAIASRQNFSWVTLVGKMWSPKDLATLEQKIHGLTGDSSAGALHR